MTPHERLSIKWLEENWEKLGPVEWTAQIFRHRLGLDENGWYRESRWSGNAVTPDKWELDHSLSSLEALSIVEHVLRERLEKYWYDVRCSNGHGDGVRAEVEVFQHNGIEGRDEADTLIEALCKSYSNTGMARTDREAAKDEPTG